MQSSHHRGPVVRCQFIRINFGLCGWSLFCDANWCSVNALALGRQNIHSAAAMTLDAGATPSRECTNARNGPNERDFAPVTIRYTNKDLLLQTTLSWCRSKLSFHLALVSDCIVASDVDLAIRHRVMHSSMRK